MTNRALSLAVAALLFASPAVAGGSQPAAPGGPNGSVQFNNNGALGGAGVTTPVRGTGVWGSFLTTGKTIVNFGDSITNGALASPTANSYASLVDADSGAVATNSGANGAMACDMGQTQVWGNTNPSLTSSALYTMMVGTNEVVYKGTGAYEPVYQSCHQADLAWLAVPSDYKVFAQNAGCSTTGTWANATTYQSGIGRSSTTSGSTLTCPITTTGGPIYVWYNRVDGNGGTFTYAVDGGAATAVNAFTSPAIATNNGGTQGLGLLRITGLAAGSHSVVFTVTSATSGSNVVHVFALGTPPGLSYASQNTVFSAGVPKQQADASAAATTQYNALAKADADLLAGDGLPVRFVDVQAYLNLATDYGDPLHPNNLGHEHLREAFEAVMQFPRIAAVPTVSFGGANYQTTNPTNLASTTALNPGFLFYSSGSYFGGDLGYNTAKSLYTARLFTAPSGGVEMGHYNGTTQSSFVPYFFANSTVFEATRGKLKVTGGTAPTISSCGTSPSISGADSSFNVTMGGGTLTSCVINFGTTWPTAPAVCDIPPTNATAAAQATTGAYVSAISTTQVTIAGLNLTGASYGVHCH